MKKAVKAKAGNVTAVLATTQRTAIYAKDLSCPKVLDIADSQARNTANAYKSTSSPIWKMIYWLESRRIGAFELECISRFDKTLFFNMEESESFGMPAKTRWIPHGVQGELFTRALPQERERAVVFFGKMDYRPNVEAVEWFCEHVLPLLPTDVRFYILGAAPNATVRALGERHAQVKVTGFLDDPYELILQCGLVVAPMQSGSGIQNKVLEAMALGMAVVGTSRAFTPILGAREGEHFIAENSAEGTAKAILALLDDPETRDRMGLTARAFISTNFSWEKWEETILDVLVEAIEAHKVVPPPAT
jgi:glycosyltransferase involved in cell wall biosynthesis